MDRQGSFTKARYLKMCALQNTLPDPKEMPLDINDFPQIVRDSIEIFNRLPDRFTTTDLGPLYTGKDIAALPVLYEHLSATDPEDKKLILEIVQHLDQKAVAREVKRFKELQKRLKNKKA